MWGQVRISKIKSCKSLLKFAKVESRSTDIESSSSLQNEERSRIPSRNTLYLNKETENIKKELPKIGRIYENKRVELNIATHNINGLKTNSQKIEALYEWIIDNELDIVGLAKMNISAKEGFFLGKKLEEFKSVWSSASSDKKKGSGIELLISKK